jgi:hypothetical protein
MPERKSFLLRLPPDLLDELNRWARDELRSLNGQIEYALREALQRRGRRAHPPHVGDQHADSRPEQEPGA